MIEVVIRAETLGEPPVVTTLGSIDQNLIQDIFGPILARMIFMVEKVTRIRPLRITLTIDWAGESDEEKPASKPNRKPSPVPKWMS